MAAAPHWHWCLACRRPWSHTTPRCRGAPSPEAAERAALDAPLEFRGGRLCLACGGLAWRGRAEGLILGALLGLIAGALLAALWR